MLFRKAKQAAGSNEVPRVVALPPQEFLCTNYGLMKNQLELTRAVSQPRNTSEVARELSWNPPEVFKDSSLLQHMAERRWL